MQQLEPGQAYVYQPSNGLVVLMYWAGSVWFTSFEYGLWTGWALAGGDIALEKKPVEQEEE